MSTILRLRTEPDQLALPDLLPRDAVDRRDLPALSWCTGDGEDDWTTHTRREVRRDTAVFAAGHTAL